MLNDQTVIDCLGHFGIPESVMNGYQFIRRGKKTIYVAGQAVALSEKAYYQGMPFMRIQTKYPKLTSVAALKFGHHATKQIVHLNESQLGSYLTRQPIELVQNQLQCCSARSFVIVFYKDSCLGVGFLGEVNKMASLSPKSWSEYRSRENFSLPKLR